MHFCWSLSNDYFMEIFLFFSMSTWNVWATLHFPMIPCVSKILGLHTLPQRTQGATIFCTLCTTFSEMQIGEKKSFIRIMRKKLKPNIIRINKKVFLHFYRDFKLIINYLTLNFLIRSPTLCDGSDGWGLGLLATRSGVSSVLRKEGRRGQDQTPGNNRYKLLACP